MVYLMIGQKINRYTVADDHTLNSVQSYTVQCTIVSEVSTFVSNPVFQILRWSGTFQKFILLKKTI